MNSKKEPKRSTSNLPTQPSTQLSFLPEDDEAQHKPKRAPRLPDGQEEASWADAETKREQKALERFLKRMHWTADYWEMKRRHYLEEPLDDDELRSATWLVEKTRHCGLSVEVALERQKKLKADLWMVAFLMAQCNGEKDIAPIMNLGLRRVQQHIAELRSIVRREVHADNDSAVIRWFMGL
jgi:hypothetical protein